MMTRLDRLVQEEQRMGGGQAEIANFHDSLTRRRDKMNRRTNTGWFHIKPANCKYLELFGLCFNLNDQNLPI